MEKATKKSGDESTTPFKRAQIRHRRRGGEDLNRVDDLDECIDFSRCGSDDRIVRLMSPTNAEDIYGGPIFGIRNVPGFLFAPQALGEDLQKEIAYRSVTEYCESPHKTNNDQCPPKKEEYSDESSTMWDLWKDEASRLGEGDMQRKKRKQTHNATTRPYRSFKKLSWSTMGYHYDWTERAYNKQYKSEMPWLVGRLSTMFARTSLLVEGSTKLSYAPTASIVNFYTTKSLMGGHRDDLEEATDKPIVSISVGLPAIFLLGGKSKEDDCVVPILIRSGDVLCMGGDCRLNYHGMARLVPSASMLPQAEKACIPCEKDKIDLDTLQSRIVASDTAAAKNGDTEFLDVFLENHRLNINVRQVYNDDN